MKRVMLFAAVILTVGFTSCGEESAKDIKVEDLNEPCDCVDAMATIMDEMIELVEEYENSDEADIPDDAEDEFEALEKKLDEVSDHCKSEFKLEDAKKCDGFDELEKKHDKL